MTHGSVDYMLKVVVDIDKVLIPVGQMDSFWPLQLQFGQVGILDNNLLKQNNGTHLFIFMICF